MIDLFSTWAISSSGLTAQRIRMNAISANLANVNTTRTASGGPYRRLNVVFAAMPMPGAAQGLVESRFEDYLRMVQVLRVVEDTRAPRQVFNPGHPDADAQGYVLLPNINLMEEMVDLLSANRAYEANVAAVNAAKSMVRKALEIGQV